MSNELRALIVEDDASWQQILAEILTDSGLEVDTADCLENAVSLLRARSHRLALVDLSLSREDHENRDGLKVLDAVRRLDPGCRSILLTGYATVELAVSALTEFSAFTFLRKEIFNRTQFRELVQRALASAPLMPEMTPVAASTSRPVDAIPSGPAGPRTVLVVDDDAGWRNILAELLRDVGFEVRLSAGFGEALGYLRRDKYALVITDLSLTGEWGPHISLDDLEGSQLLRAAQTSGIPTIVVSGVSTPEDIKKTYNEQGVFAYIEKQTFERAAFRKIAQDAVYQIAQTSDLDGLTDREHEVLDLLAKGLTNKEIAEKLVITTNTVKRHLKAIFEKLNVHTRSAAAAKAVIQG